MVLDLVLRRRRGGASARGTAGGAGLAELVRAKINPALELICKPLPQDDPLQRQPVINLAQQELGWQPTIALDQGLDATIAYFKEALA